MDRPLPPPFFPRRLPLMMGSIVDTAAKTKSCLSCSCCILPPYEPASDCKHFLEDEVVQFESRVLRSKPRNDVYSRRGEKHET